MTQPSPEDAPFILWSDGYSEGWTPYPCDTLDDCLRTITSYSISSYIITRPVKVTLTERTAPVHPNRLEEIGR